MADVAGLVTEAVERDIASWGMAGTGLAASALTLAAKMDDPGTTAASVSMCANALNTTLTRLREMSLATAKADRLDDLRERRAKRLAKATG